jgi:hypothetical protein
MPDIKPVYRKLFLAAVLAVAGSLRAQNVTLRNVVLDVGDGVAMRIPRLDGTIVVTTDRLPATLARDTIVIRIAAAEVRFSTQSLTNLMNKHVLIDGANITHLTIGTDATKHEVIINGPVELRGPMVVREESIHVQRNKRWLPGVDSLINWKRGAEHGVTAANHEIILDPLKMIAPLLRIEGHLTGIAVEGDEIVETFGPAGVSPPADDRGSVRIDGDALLSPSCTLLSDGWCRIDIGR